MMLAGLALAASLVLAAAAAASASAAEIFLTNAPYPQPIVTTDNNPAVLTSGLTKVTCTSLLGKGTLLNPKKALLLLLFHGCKDNVGNECNSAGEPKGLIHTLLLVLPVWLDKNSPKTLPGLLFEKHQGNTDIATFKCGINTVLVRGTVLGHIPKPAPRVASHTLEVEILVKGTSQEFEKVEEGTEIFKLEVSINGGGFASGTEEVVKDVVEFENAGVNAEFK